MENQLLKEKLLNAQLLLDLEQFQHDYSHLQQVAQESTDKESQFYLFQLNQQIQQKNDRIHEFEAETAQAKRLASEIQEELERKEADLAGLTSQIKIQEETILEQGAEARKADAQIINLQRRCDDIEGQRRELNDQLLAERLRFQQYAAENNVDKFRTQIKNLETALEDATKERDEAFEELTKSNATNEKLASAYGEMKLLYDRLRDLHEEQRPHQACQSVPPVLVIKKAMDESACVISLKQQIAKLRRREAASLEQYQELDRIKQQLEEQLFTARQQAEEESEHQKQRQQQASQAQEIVASRIAELEAEVSELRTELQSTTMLLADTQKELNGVGSFIKITDLGQDESINNFGAQLAHLQQMVALKELEADQLRASLRDVEREQQLDDMPIPIERELKINRLQATLAETRALIPSSTIPGRTSKKKQRNSQGVRHPSPSDNAPPTLKRSVSQKEKRANLSSSSSVSALHERRH